MSVNDITSAYRHCEALLRQEDRPRYAAWLFVGEACRRHVMALDAFRLEVLRIPFLVSEPIPGEIRLQWWREVIDGERSAEAQANPVSLALCETIREAGLSVAAFGRYLEAVAFDLYHDPMPDLAAFEGWAGETEAFLLQCAALACGAETGTALADACGHGGMALAIARLLRLLAWHRASEQVHLPAGMLAAVGLDRDTWLGEAGDSHRQAVLAFAALGRDHVSRARASIRMLDKRVQPVFLPLCEAGALIAKASKAPQLALAGRLDTSPLALQWCMWKTAATGF